MAKRKKSDKPISVMSLAGAAHLAEGSLPQPFQMAGLRALVSPLAAAQRFAWTITGPLFALRRRPLTVPFCAALGSMRQSLLMDGLFGRCVRPLTNPLKNGGLNVFCSRSERPTGSH